jgi:hypothetical protein
MFTMTTDTRKEVQDQIKSGKDLKRFYKGFHYGEFGSTKTVTAGKLSRIKFLVIATDNGWTSLDNHDELVDKYDVLPYDGLSQLDEVAAWSHESDFPYDLLHLDTVSQMQEEYLDFLLDEITWSQNFREKSQTKRRGAETVEVPGRADYHVTRNKMRGPIKNLIKAPVDVVFSAHLREPTEDEKSKGNFVRRPTLTQTVYSLIAREASVMALFERTKTGGVQIKCETDAKQVAKSRIKSLDGQTVGVDKFVSNIHEWKDR